MRWLSSLAAAAAFLLSAAPALALSPGVMETAVPPFSAQPGTPISVTIEPNGYFADVLVSGMTCAKASSAYSATPDSTPKLSIAVTSPGYNSSGVLTSVSRTVVGTTYKRRPYPNETQPDEQNTKGGCLTKWGLSDYVNQSDYGTVTLLAGLYTSQGYASLAKTLPLVNSSTLPHPKPICAILTPPHQIVGSSDNFTAEAICFHQRPRSGQQVAAVKFDISDGTNHVSGVSSSMTLSALSSVGNPVYVYSYTFTAGSLSTLTSGSCAAGASCEVTLDMFAYPFVGDTVLQASLGQSGTALAASSKSPNLHAINIVWDQAAAHTPLYAWVSTTGTCTTTACISTSSTDPGSGASANYATFYNAANQCRSYNSTNRAHNDTSGCRIKVRAGTYNGFNTSAGSELNTLASGIGNLRFEAAPGESNTTVVVTPAASSGGKRTVKDRTWFVDIGFAQVDNTLSAYNQILTGTTTVPGTINEEIVCVRCRMSPLVTSADWPMVYQIGQVYWLDATINAATIGQTSGILRPYGNRPYAGKWIGGTLTFSGAAKLFPYVVAGSQMTGVAEQDDNPATFTSMIQPTGEIVYSTSWMKMNTTNPFAFSWFDNVAAVQNVFESIQATTAPFQFWADNNVTHVYNGIVSYNTFAGGRYNFSYNEFPGDCYFKYVVDLYNAVDPMSGQGRNIKTDTYTSGGNGDGRKVCNWMAVYGVGSGGTVFNGDANGDSNVGPTSWFGMYTGKRGGSNTNTLFGQSIVFTTNHSKSGDSAGNGNYVLTGSTGSVAYGRVPNGEAGLPKDLAGNDRRTDGTGCSGAYEC